jgi:pyroglutamyl-peptidase
VLLTGFGRFPGAAFNPTGPLVRHLTKIRRPTFANFRLVSHVFPTSYAAVDRELPHMIAQHRPDIILMFGLATRARTVRIETLARNALSSFPDAMRFSPRSRSIAAGPPIRRQGQAPVLRMLQATRERGVAAKTSRNAGRYLCNYVYWRALEQASSPDGPALVAFVHVPPAVGFGCTGPSRGILTYRALLPAAEAILAAIIGEFGRTRLQKHLCS